MPTRRSSGPSAPLCRSIDGFRPSRRRTQRQRHAGSSASIRVSPSALLLAGWFAGVALFLLPMVVGLWQVRSLRRSALPWPHGQSVAERLARDAGIHRRVEVLLHEALPGPMTCGVVRPAIVLPPDAQTWEADDLNRALVMNWNTCGAATG